MNTSSLIQLIQVGDSVLIVIDIQDRFLRGSRRRQT